MRRERLRPAYGLDDLARIYARPHQHAQWHDHQVRVAVTVQIAHAVAGAVRTAADLSCGDGAVLSALNVENRILGDFAPGYPITGPIEQTIETIPQVDLLVCCETLEHLDEPDTVLKQARDVTDVLVLSTPVEAWADLRNPEHYWAWDREAVDDMIVKAGFRVALYCEVDTQPGGGEYRFGIWGAR